MCALVRRLLMTMYSDQRIQVTWSNVLSEMFHMKNGVKQGAVLSPKLFTVVLDGLLDNLLQSGVGCRIDNIFAGEFGYADNITLLAPSVDALKITISICEEYAYEFSILFNPRKSKLMCFNPREPTVIHFQKTCSMQVNKTHTHTTFTMCYQYCIN